TSAGGANEAGRYYYGSAWNSYLACRC
ncbi:MAG: hypothetical protein JWN41_313, partial [Thermoleophilia bacterium]|nr:hypothetical protein [Thermoleophilia bacterium]